MLAGRVSLAFTLALVPLIRVNVDARVTHEESASGARISALIVQSSSPTNPATSRRTTRRLGAITIVEQDEAKLTDEDVRSIQSVLAPKRVWWIHAGMINAATAGASGPEWLLGVDACMQPEVVTPGFRRGHCVRVTKLPNEGWWRAGQLDEFAQVALAGEDLALEQPARLIRMGIGQPIDDDTLRSVMTFVRSRAVAVETSQRKSDIQPYPINRIMTGGDNNRLIVELRHRERPIYQTIVVERSGNSWRIIQML